MKKKRYIAYELKRLHNQFLKLVAGIHADVEGMESITSLQGWVIAFLFHEGGDRDIFQKDIEAECDIRGSTTTSLLKRMEKNGLIVREKLSEDARWKRITLTPKAKKVCRTIEAFISNFETQMSKGVTQKELEVFFTVVDKLYSNLSKENWEKF